MCLAAFAFLIAGAVKFSIPLLIIAWAVMVYALFKHNFFEGKTAALQIIGNLCLSVAIAGVFIIVWICLQPNIPPTVEEERAAITPQRFITTSETPESDFHVTREWIGIAPLTRNKKTYTSVTVMLSITNLGSPSAATNWLLAVRLPGNDTPIGCDPIPLHGTLTLAVDGQRDTILDSRDVIANKTLEPIPTGGIRKGFLHFWIQRNISIINVPGASLEIWFKDVRGKEYKTVIADSLPLTKTDYQVQFTPGVDIQKSKKSR